jgi:hypothetical protein
LSETLEIDAAHTSLSISLTRESSREPEGINEALDIIGEKDQAGYWFGCLFA